MKGSALSLLFLPLLALPSPARPDTLGYGTRTRPFAGFNTAVHGDIRAVGMAGANVALGDTFIASTENPAGLAMTLKDADANFTTNWARDARIQSYSFAYDTTNAGVALAPYPWGLSLGYVSPYSEGGSGTYSPVDASVQTREFSVSGARLLLGNHLSLGASLIAHQAERVYGGQSFATWALAGSFGALVQMPSRVLFGISYHFGVEHPGAPAASQPAGLPGFFQGLLVPSRMGVGLAWVPNRFFRAGMSLHWVNATPGAALLRSEDARAGDDLVVQPRLGASYQWIDYKIFQGYVHAGSYLEFSRIRGAPPRVHGTAGAEVAPWVFILGWGVDAAPDYQNLLVSFGVNVVKALDVLKLIPHAGSPPDGGLLPRPGHPSDTGLARPLVADWRPQGPQIDPIQAGLQIPARAGKQVDALGDKIGSVVDPTSLFKKGPESKKKTRRRERR